MTTRSILLLVFICGTSFADDIYAKQGTSPMAKDVIVLEETSQKIYYLDKRLKKRALSMAMVGRVEKRRCVVHEYKDKEGAARTADEFMALATWARSMKFHKDVLRLAHERALAADPDHEGANLALGRVRYKGEWMTPAQRSERMGQDADAEKRAGGLVKYKDEWVTAEDKARLERGLVKYKGAWMTQDQMKREMGYVKHEGKWVKQDDLAVLKLIGPARKATGLGDRLKLVQTQHCAVMGDLPPANLKQLADSMEKLLAEWYRLWPKARDTDLVAGKYRLYAFKKNRPYQKLVKAEYSKLKAAGFSSKRRAKEEQARMKLRLKETSFWEIYPPMSVHVQMPDPFEGLRSHCIHFAANVLVTRHDKVRWATWWLNEGIAYYFEKKVTGAIQTFNVDVGGGGGYADSGSLDSEKKNPWVDAGAWNNLLTNLIRTGRDPKLQKIKGMNLYDPKNSMGYREIAKAASVVQFLIRDNARKFAAFVDDAKAGSSGTAVEREVAAMIKHYGSYGKVETAWKKYALNGFRIAR